MKELEFNPDPRPLVFKITLAELMNATPEQRERLFMEYDDRLFALFSSRRGAYDNIGDHKNVSYSEIQERAYPFFMRTEIHEATVYRLRKIYSDLTDILIQMDFAKIVEFHLLPI